MFCDCVVIFFLTAPVISRQRGGPREMYIEGWVQGPARKYLTDNSFIPSLCLQVKSAKFDPKYRRLHIVSLYNKLSYSSPYQLSHVAQSCYSVIATYWRHALPMEQAKIRPAVTL